MCSAYERSLASRNYLLSEVTCRTALGPLPRQRDAEGGRGEALAATAPIAGLLVQDPANASMFGPLRGG